MKWILALVIIVGLVWLGGDRLSGLIDSGRESVGAVVAEPVYNLSDTLEQTRARVDETNRKIEALGGYAASVAPPSNAASAYGAQARRDLQALNR